MAEQQKNDTGKTSVVILASIVAITTGVYAMHAKTVEPMSQQIKTLEENLKHTRHQMEKGHDREATTRNMLAAFQERFGTIVSELDAEKGMRLRNERDLSAVQTWIHEHDRIIEKRDAEQWERLKAVERVVYSGEGKNP